ncbi:DUF2059 domain-containing protein [Roseovarius sp. 2305UL8-3]|uniref:DUF2059 domain-containing protein n=1 Tax=Roseovarius conchicola TaxID=3121636 RepID=UPI0035277A0A
MSVIPFLHSRFFTLLIALTTVSFLASAPGHAADRDRLEAFLEVTGFDVALDSIALSAEHAPDMLGLQTSDFGDNWRVMAEQVFDSDVMHEMALDILEQTLSDELLAHAAGFYASDLGQRLVEVENASHMVEDDDAKREEGEALLAEYGTGSGTRGELLAQLNEAVDSAGTGVRAIQELQVRFLMAASHAGVLENEIDEGTLRALLREGEDELRDSLKESSLASAAYTYRDVSDEDVMAYRDALRDPKMKQVYELMNAIQHEVMANRFEALADRMAGVQRGEDL